MTHEATHTLDDEPFIPDGEPATDPDDGALVLEGMVMRMSLDERGRDEWAPILLVSKDAGQSWQTEQGKAVVLKAISVEPDPCMPEIPSGDLTVEQAQAYERSQWWKGKPAHEIVLVQIQLDRICMPFGEFRTLADRATGQMLCDSAFATEESRRSLALAIQEQRAATLTAVTIALCEHWDGKCDPRSLVELLADPYDLSVPEIDEICERLKVIANAVALADVQSTQTSKEPS